MKRLLAIFAIAAALAASACTNFAAQVDGGSHVWPVRQTVNNAARSAAHVLRRQGHTVPDDALEGWTLRWCFEFACSSAHPGAKLLYVRADRDWHLKLSHEVTHAILFEADYPDALSHHDWMGKHGFCYNSPLCNDRPTWNPDNPNSAVQ